MNRLVLFGLLIIIVGMGMLAIGSASQGGVSTGGFILIGPIPIVFGSGPGGGQLATLALVAGLLMFGLLAVIAWRFVSRAKSTMGSASGTAG